MRRFDATLVVGCVGLAVLLLGVLLGGRFAPRGEGEARWGRARATGTTDRATLAADED
jgi:hypothetical protein